MSKTRGRATPQQAETAPSSFPETPPPKWAQPGHDFTLQAVIEMQKSLGELTAKVDRLIDDVSSHSKKIDTVRMRLNWLAGAAAGVGVLVGALFSVWKFIPWQQISGH